MVSILISRSKLGHLQKHVCSYIVAAISKKASCLMMTGRCPCVLSMARWTLEPIYGIRDKHQYSQFKSLDIYMKSFQNLLTRRKTDTRIEQESRANRCRGSADYSKNGKSVRDWKIKQESRHTCVEVSLTILKIDKNTYTYTEI